MGAVYDFVEDTVSSIGDAVGDVVESVGEVAQNIVTEVVEPVADVVGKVVDSAMQDPIGTIAKVAVGIVAPELLPLVSAADTVAHGGDLGDALKSAALTYSAQGIGQYVGGIGDQAGASAEYGTNLGSQQTAMLAAQDAGMKTAGDIFGNVAGSTAAGIVRGQDPLSALVSGGVSAGTSAVTSQIDGFENLPKSVQNSVNAAVSATLRGGDPSNALINAAINAGISEAQNPSSATETPAAPAENGLASLTDVANQDTGIPPAEDGLASLTDVANQDTGLPALMNTTNQNAEPAPAEKTQDQMTPKDWAALYATPTTNPATGETIVGGDVSEYPVQKMDIGEQLNEGGDNAYAGWKVGEDGSHTYTWDDGSTMTVDENGEVIDVTEATDTAYKPDETKADTKKQSSVSVNPQFTFGNLGSYVLPAIAGAGIASLTNNNSSNNSANPANDQTSEPQNELKMDWNQQRVNDLINGAAYGQQYFDPTFVPQPIQAAQGGLMGLAHGGQSDLGSYSDGGRLLRGPGDGMSDNIPATINRKQPARLADGEFVVPADVVSHLGNGSTDAGSKVLYKMMDKVRRARTGNSKQGKQINPNKFVPS